LGRARLLRHAAPVDRRPLDDVEYDLGAPGAAETAIRTVAQPARLDDATDAN